MALELSSFTSSRFTHGSPGRDPSELHIELRVQVGGGETKRFLRILNGRSQPLERAVLSLSNDSFASFRLRRQPTGLTFGSLPATSIVALLAWSASHCSFRLTHSGRFLLRRIAHWATASFVPLFHTEHRALQTSCRAELLIFPLIFFLYTHICSKVPYQTQSSADKLQI